MNTIYTHDYEIYCAIVSALERIGFRVSHELVLVGERTAKLARLEDGKQVEVTCEDAW